MLKVVFARVKLREYLCCMILFQEIMVSIERRLEMITLNLVEREDLIIVCCTVKNSLQCMVLHVLCYYE